ncbi:MAG: FUSC family protein [Variovorax sp.]
MIRSAFAWSREPPVGPAEILSSALAMSGAVIVGVAFGQPALGLNAAIGAFVVDSGRTTGATREYSVGWSLASVLAASAMAPLLAGPGFGGDLVLAVAALMATALGNVSRPTAAASARFVVLAVIVRHAAQVSVHAGVVVPAAIVGVAGITAFLRALIRRLLPRQIEPVEPQSKPEPTWSARFTRWKRVMRSLEGWQYPVRLVIGLLVAGALRWQWPSHHLHWVALTVALLTERTIEVVPLRLVQRLGGTLLGVALASAIPAVALPTVALVALVGVLGGLRPWLRARNYLVYTVAMTPLVVLTMDAGTADSGSSLVDRVIASAIGGVLVIALNALFISRVEPRPPPPISPHSRPPSR